MTSVSFSKSPIGVSKIGTILRELFPDSDSADRNEQQSNQRQTGEVQPLDPAQGLATKPQTVDVEEKAAEETNTLAEEAAMILAAQKDPNAFGVVYERYLDRVYAYIYNRVGNAQDAEDLTARTFYKALSRLSSYEDRGYPFSAWLFRIAHNLVANWHRDHSKRRFLSLDRLWSHSRDDALPEQHVEQEEKHGALWEAIDRLPDDRRNLLIYKFSSRLSNVEIGELMDKSESAIKSLYFRTLAALRTDLEAHNWEK